jgi:hypothetical protein
MEKYETGRKHFSQIKDGQARTVSVRLSPGESIDGYRHGRRWSGSLFAGIAIDARRPQITRRRFVSAVG